MVRVKYSTIINYLSILYRTLISLGFIVIIVRKLSPIEFGTWGIIISLIYIMQQGVNLWGYWVRRHIAYELKGMKQYRGVGITGLLVTIFYLSICTIIYIVISIAYSYIVQEYQVFFIYSIPLIIIYGIATYLTSIVSTLKPEAIGYTNYIMETLRFILGYILIIIFKLGLLGVILSYMISMLSKSMITLKYILNILRSTFKHVNFKLLKQWIKHIYIPLLNYTSHSIVGVDRSIASLISSSPLTSTYLSIAYTVRRPLSSGNVALTSSLYAGLMIENNIRYFTDVVRISFFPSIFISATAIVLARQFVAILNPRYVNISTLFSISAYTTILMILENIVLNTIVGYERFDTNLEREKIFRNFIKTKTYKVYLLLTTRNILVLLIASVISLYYIDDPYTVAFIYVLSLMIGFTASILILYIFVLRSLLIKYTPWKDLFAYFIAAMVSTIMYILLDVTDLELTHLSIYNSIMILTPYILLGFTLYVIISLMLSTWLRNFILKLIFKY